MGEPQQLFMHPIEAATPRRPRTLWFALEHGLPLLVYTVLAVVLTWPLAVQLGAAFPAAPGEGAQDLWQNVWNLWWAGAALRRGVSPFFADTLFYPTGASLLFHPLNLTSGLLAIPLRALGGEVVAYNVLALLSFTLSGYALFLLARRHGCGHAAALLGGLVYTAAAFHFYHLRLGHLEQISMQWLPLYALALDALLRPTTDHRPPTTDRPEPRTENRNKEQRTKNKEQERTQHAIRNTQYAIRNTVGRVLLATLALLAVIFTSLYMALYAALLTGLWVVWAVVGALRPHLQPTAQAGAGARLQAPLLQLAAMHLLTLAIVGPVLLLPMAREAGTNSYMLPGVEATARGSAAPADIVLPPDMHPLHTALGLPQPFKASVFLGYIPLALAVYGAVARPAQAWRWLVLALLAWALSLGPALPLYRLLSALPLLQTSRYPDRFALLTLLAVALLAALGAQALLGRLAERVRLPATALLLGLLLFELYPGPIPLTPPPDDPFYQSLARTSGQFSVYEMPINRANGAWMSMYAQTIHEHPILDGALARPAPRIPFEWLPLMRELEHPGATTDIMVQTAEQRAAALRFFNLRYLLYHREDENGPVTPPPAEALAHVAGVPVSQMYADATLVAYRLDLPDGPAALPAVATFGAGWSNLESPGLNAHRWLTQSGGSVQIYAPQDGTITLGLKLVAYRQPHRLDIYLDDQQIGQIQAQPWPTKVRTSPFELREGLHTLRLVPSGPGISPRSAGEGDDDRLLTISVFELEIGD
jgi:hypothetical protein